MCIVRDGDDLTGEDVCPLLELQKKKTAGWLTGVWLQGKDIKKKKSLKLAI